MLYNMSSCLTRKNNLLANADALKFNNVVCWEHPKKILLQFKIDYGNGLGSDLCATLMGILQSHVLQLTDHKFKSSLAI